MRVCRVRPRDNDDDSDGFYLFFIFFFIFFLFFFFYFLFFIFYFSFFEFSIFPLLLSSLLSFLFLSSLFSQDPTQTFCGCELIPSSEVIPDPQFGTFSCCVPFCCQDSGFSSFFLFVFFFFSFSFSFSFSPLFLFLFLFSSFFLLIFFSCLYRYKESLWKRNKSRDSKKLSKCFRSICFYMSCFNSCHQYPWFLFLFFFLLLSLFLFFFSSLFFSFPPLCQFLFNSKILSFSLFLSLSNLSLSLFFFSLSLSLSLSLFSLSFLLHHRCGSCVIICWRDLFLLYNFYFSWSFFI